MAEAVSIAAGNIGLDVRPNVVATLNAPEGSEKRQTARATGLSGPVWVQLVWVPMTQDSLRLSWRVVLGAPNGEHYLVLVDAETGDIPVRHSLTADISAATYNVYTNDSPSPFSPGSIFPSGFQPTNVNRSLVTTAALSTNASPEGWIPDGENTTSGNNVIAFRDRDGDGVPDVPLPAGNPDRIFDFPLSLVQNPLSYADASTVQLFYQANWYHDRLYSMGFTENSGNFQSNNFTKGGKGGDPVIAHAQASADVGQANNANFSTPPDGMPGVCNMYVFTGPSPDRDGSLDSEVVFHELTHGLSNRLLGGGVGINALQTQGMGEGWSDFMALCLLSQATDNPDGVYAAGGYATYKLNSPNFVDNYYFGIRRYPYSTDMSKNPLTFKDIDPNQASPHAGIPISPVSGGGDPSEAHASGEVWCMMLREVWAGIVKKSGWQIGNEMAMQLVVDGLKLGPPNATFIEARDAIIQADLIDTGGDNFNEIWIAFAKRGMGFGASCPQSFSTLGIVESFELPPDFGIPDGILEVKVTPPNFEAMFAGDTNIIFVRVTDVASVTNATISATIVGGTNIVFRNDGVPPDLAASNAIYSATLVVPTNQASVTINMVISAPGKDTSTNTVTYFIVPIPANDNFANAFKVPVNGTNYITNNKKATLELSEPTHAGVNTARGSLWWNYTPTVNTNLLIDTGGSGVRTIIAVYTNSTLSTLQPVVSATGTDSRPGAQTKFSVIGGRTYRIAVAGYDRNNLGTISLAIAQGADADTNAPTVTITSPPSGLIVTSNRVTLIGSAVDSNPNASGIRDINIRVVGIPPLAPPMVYSFNSLTGPLNTNWTRIVGLLPGLNSIAATVTDFAGNRSAPSEIEVNYRVNDPPNDFFVSAIAMTNSSGISVVNTLDATKEAGEPNHAGFEGGKSAWWVFTPTNDGALTLSTSNSTFDTVMAIYTGNSVGGLTAIAGNDDAYPGSLRGFSQIIAPVRTNKTYHIAVDSYDGSGGVVFFGWSFVPAPVYRLTISNTPGGTVAPSSLDVLNNTPVSLLASANANYNFDIWDGSVYSIANPLNFTVNRDMSVTAHFVPVQFTDGFETGNFLHLNWVTSGNQPWIVQSNSVALGQFAARSGAITHGQSSSLLLTANFRVGAGSFDYRVSSEPTFDALKFFIDGVLQQQWSGDVGWANFAFSVPAGTHTLEWRYSKDPSVTGGLDTAFIDDVNLPIIVGTSSASIPHLDLQRQTDGGFFINLTGQINQQYVVQASTNLVNWENLSTNVLTSGFLRVADPSSTTSKTRFYRAIAVPGP
jgi:hypothetical protein